MNTIELLIGVLLVVIVIAALVIWYRRRLAALDEIWRRRLEETKQENETSVAELRARQQSIFDSMAEGILLLDQEGRIQFANIAFKSIFNVAGELNARTVMEVTRLHEAAGLVQEVLKGGEARRAEVWAPGPPERWLEMNAAVIGNSHGPSVAVLVCHDVTPLKQLEITRRDFVANVSHELRTPLSLIKGYVETLQDGAMNDPVLAEKFLGTIARNSERLQLLIDDLLVISELESGRVQLQLQAFPLERVVRRVFQDFAGKAEARGVQLVDETGGQRVQADETRVEQVLGNLVDNALKYGTLDSKVVVGARSLEDGFVEVFARNDGPGIPADSLSRLFERFFRVDKGRSREEGGTGLGLAIVKHIVQNHGGKVWATSESGKGATFHFTLPGSLAT